MDKKKMLLSIIAHYAGGNKARFAQMVEVTPQAVSTWLSRENFDTDKIFAKCEGISADWLLTGEGDMLKKTSDKTEAHKSDDLIDYLKEEIGRLREENKELVHENAYLRNLANQSNTLHEQTA